MIRDTSSPFQKIKYKVVRKEGEDSPTVEESTGSTQVSVSSTTVTTTRKAVLGAGTAATVQTELVGLEEVDEVKKLVKSYLEKIEKLEEENASLRDTMGASAAMAAGEGDEGGGRITSHSHALQCPTCGTSTEEHAAGSSQTLQLGSVQTLTQTGIRSEEAIDTVTKVSQTVKVFRSSTQTTDETFHEAQHRDSTADVAVTSVQFGQQNLVQKVHSLEVENKVLKNRLETLGETYDPDSAEVEDSFVTIAMGQEALGEVDIHTLQNYSKEELLTKVTQLITENKTLKVKVEEVQILSPSKVNDADNTGGHRREFQEIEGDKRALEQLEPEARLALFQEGNASLTVQVERPKTAQSQSNDAMQTIIENNLVQGESFTHAQYEQQVVDMQVQIDKLKEENSTLAEQVQHSADARTETQKAQEEVAHLRSEIERLTTEKDNYAQQVERSREVIALGGDGALRELTEGISSLQAQLKEKTDELEYTEEILASKRAELDTVRQQKYKFEDEKTRLEGEASKLSVMSQEIETLKAQLEVSKKAEVMLVETLEQVGALQTENARLESERGALSLKVDETARDFMKVQLLEQEVEKLNVDLKKQEETEKELQDVKESLDVARRERASLLEDQAAYNRHKEDVREAKEKIEVLQETLAVLVEQARDTEKMERDLETALTEARENLAAVTSEKAVLLQDAESRTKELEAAEEKIQTLQGQVKELDAKDTTLTTTKEQFEYTKKELDALQVKNAELETQVAEISDLKKEITVARAVIEQLREGDEDTKSKHKEESAKLENDLKIFKKNMDALQTEKDAIEGKFSSSVQELEETRIHIKALEAEKQTLLTSEQKQKAKDLQEAQDQLKVLSEENKRLLKEQDNFQKQSEDLHVARKQIQSLQEKFTTQAELFDKIQGDLTKNVELVQDLQLENKKLQDQNKSLSEKKEKEHHERVITLETEIVELTSRLEKAAEAERDLQVKEKELAIFRAEKEHLIKEREVYQIQFAQKEKEVANAASLESEVSSLKEKMKDLKRSEQELAQFQGKFAVIKQEVEDKAKALEALQKEKEGLSNQINEMEGLKKEIAIARNVIQELRESGEKTSEHEKKSKELTSILERTRKEVNILQEEKEEMSKYFASSQKELQDARTQIELLEDEKQTLNSTSQDATELKTQLEEAKMSLTTELQNFFTVQTELQGALEKIQTLEKEKRLLEEEVKEVSILESELSVVREQVHQHQVEKRSTADKVEAKEIQTDSGIAKKRAAKLKQDKIVEQERDFENLTKDLEAAKQEIQRLKQERDNLDDASNYTTTMSTSVVITTGEGVDAELSEAMEIIKSLEEERRLLKEEIRMAHQKEADFPMAMDDVQSQESNKSVANVKYEASDTPTDNKQDRHSEAEYPMARGTAHGSENQMGQPKKELQTEMQDDSNTEPSVSPGTSPTILITTEVDDIQTEVQELKERIQVLEKEKLLLQAEVSTHRIGASVGGEKPLSQGSNTSSSERVEGKEIQTDPGVARKRAAKLRRERGASGRDISSDETKRKNTVSQQERRSSSEDEDIDGGGDEDSNIERFVSTMNEELHQHGQISLDRVEAKEIQTDRGVARKRAAKLKMEKRAGVGKRQWTKETQNEIQSLRQDEVGDYGSDDDMIERSVFIRSVSPNEETLLHGSDSSPSERVEAKEIQTDPGVARKRAAKLRREKGASRQKIRSEETKRDSKLTKKESSTENEEDGDASDEDINIERSVSTRNVPSSEKGGDAKDIQTEPGVARRRASKLKKDKEMASDDSKKTKSLKVELQAARKEIDRLQEIQIKMAAELQGASELQIKYNEMKVQLEEMSEKKEATVTDKREVTRQGAAQKEEESSMTTRIQKLETNVYGMKEPKYSLQTETSDETGAQPSPRLTEDGVAKKGDFTLEAHSPDLAPKAGRYELHIVDATYLSTLSDAEKVSVLMEQLQNASVAMKQLEEEKEQLSLEATNIVALQQQLYRVQTEADQLRQDKDDIIQSTGIEVGIEADHGSFREDDEDLDDRLKNVTSQLLQYENIDRQLAEAKDTVDTLLSVKTSLEERATLLETQSQGNEEMLRELVKQNTEMRDELMSVEFLKKEVRELLFGDRSPSLASLTPMLSPSSRKLLEVGGASSTRFDFAGTRRENQRSTSRQKVGGTSDTDDIDGTSSQCASTDNYTTAEDSARSTSDSDRDLRGWTPIQSSGTYESNREIVVNVVARGGVRVESDDSQDSIEILGVSGSHDKQETTGSFSGSTSSTVVQTAHFGHKSHTTDGEITPTVGGHVASRKRLTYQADDKGTVEDSEQRRRTMGTSGTEGGQGPEDMRKMQTSSHGHDTESREDTQANSARHDKREQPSASGGQPSNKMEGVQAKSHHQDTSITRRDITSYSDEKMTGQGSTTDTQGEKISQDIGDAFIGGPKQKGGDDHDGQKELQTKDIPVSTTSDEVSASGDTPNSGDIKHVDKDSHEKSGVSWFKKNVGSLFGPKLPAKGKTDDSVTKDAKEPGETANTVTSALKDINKRSSLLSQPGDTADQGTTLSKPSQDVSATDIDTTIEQQLDVSAVTEKTKHVIKSTQYIKVLIERIQKIQICIWQNFSIGDSSNNENSDVDSTIMRKNEELKENLEEMKTVLASLQSSMSHESNNDDEGEIEDQDFSKEQKENLIANLQQLSASSEELKGIQEEMANLCRSNSDDSSKSSQICSIIERLKIKLDTAVTTMQEMEVHIMKDSKQTEEKQTVDQKSPHEEETSTKGFFDGIRDWWRGASDKRSPTSKEPIHHKDEEGKGDPDERDIKDADAEAIGVQEDITAFHNVTLGGQLQLLSTENESVTDHQVGTKKDKTAVLTSSGQAQNKLPEDEMEAIIKQQAERDFLREEVVSTDAKRRDNTTSDEVMAADSGQAQNELPENKRKKIIQQQIGHSEDKEQTKSFVTDTRTLNALLEKLQRLQAIIFHSYEMHTRLANRNEDTSGEDAIIQDTANEMTKKLKEASRVLEVLQISMSDKENEEKGEKTGGLSFSQQGRTDLVSRLEMLSASISELTPICGEIGEFYNQDQGDKENVHSIVYRAIESLRIKLSTTTEVNRSIQGQVVSLLDDEKAAEEGPKFSQEIPPEDPKSSTLVVGQTSPVRNVPVREPSLDSILAPEGKVVFISKTEKPGTNVSVNTGIGTTESDVISQAAISQSQKELSKEEMGMMIQQRTEGATVTGLDDKDSVKARERGQNVTAEHSIERSKPRTFFGGLMSWWQSERTNGSTSNNVSAVDNKESDSQSQTASQITGLTHTSEAEDGETLPTSRLQNVHTIKVLIEELHVIRADMADTCIEGVSKGSENVDASNIAPIMQIKGAKMREKLEEVTTVLAVLQTSMDVDVDEQKEDTTDSSAETGQRQEVHRKLQDLSICVEELKKIQSDIESSYKRLGAEDGSSDEPTKTEADISRDMEGMAVKTDEALQSVTLIEQQMADLRDEEISQKRKQKGTSESPTEERSGSFLGGLSSWWHRGPVKESSTPKPPIPGEEADDDVNVSKTEGDEIAEDAVVPDLSDEAKETIANMQIMWIYMEELQNVYRDMLEVTTEGASVGTNGDTSKKAKEKTVEMDRKLDSMASLVRSTTEISNAEREHFLALMAKFQQMNKNLAGLKTKREADAERGRDTAYVDAKIQRKTERMGNRLCRMAKMVKKIEAQAINQLTAETDAGFFGGIFTTKRTHEISDGQEDFQETTSEEATDTDDQSEEDSIPAITGTMVAPETTAFNANMQIIASRIGEMEIVCKDTIDDYNSKNVESKPDDSDMTSKVEEGMNTIQEKVDGTLSLLAEVETGIPTEVAVGDQQESDKGEQKKVISIASTVLREIHVLCIETIDIVNAPSQVDDQDRDVTATHEMVQNNMRTIQTKLGTLPEIIAIRTNIASVEQVSTTNSLDIEDENQLKTTLPPRTNNQVTSTEDLTINIQKAMTCITELDQLQKTTRELYAERFREDINNVRSEEVDQVLKREMKNMGSQICTVWNLIPEKQNEAQSTDERVAREDGTSPPMLTDAGWEKLSQVSGSLQELKTRQETLLRVYQKRVREGARGNEGESSCLLLDTQMEEEMEGIKANTGSAIQQLSEVLEELNAEQPDDDTTDAPSQAVAQVQHPGIISRLFWWRRKDKDDEDDDTAMPEETMILIANMQILWVYITEMKETQTNLHDAYSDRFGDGITDEKCQEVDKTIQVHKESMDAKVERALSVVQEIQESSDVEQNEAQQAKANTKLQKVASLIQEVRDTNIQVSEMFQKQSTEEEGDGKDGDSKALIDVRMQEELQKMTLKLTQTELLVTAAERLAHGHKLPDETERADEETLDSVTDSAKKEEPKRWFGGWWSNQETKQPSLSIQVPIEAPSEVKEEDEEERASENVRQSTGPFRRLLRWWSSGYNTDHLTFPEKDEVYPEVAATDVPTVAETTDEEQTVPDETDSREDETLASTTGILDIEEESPIQATLPARSDIHVTSKEDLTINVQKAMTFIVELDELQKTIEERRTERFRKDIHDVQGEEVDQILKREMKNMGSQICTVWNLIPEKQDVAQLTDETVARKDGTRPPMLTDAGWEKLFQVNGSLQELKTRQETLLRVYQKRVREGARGNEGESSCLLLDTQMEEEMEGIKANTGSAIQQLSEVLEELNAEQPDDDTTDAPSQAVAQVEHPGIISRLFWWRRKDKDDGDDDTAMPEETMILIANMQILWVYITEMKETQTSLHDAYSDVRFGDGITDEKCQEVDKTIQVHKESMDAKVERALSVVQEIQESSDVEQNEAQQARANTKLQTVSSLIQEVRDTNIQVSEIFLKQSTEEEEDGKDEDSKAFVDARMQQELQNMSMKITQTERLVTAVEKLALGYKLPDETDSTGDDTEDSVTDSVPSEAKKEEPKGWSWGWWSSQETTEPNTQSSVETSSEDKEEDNVIRIANDEVNASEKVQQSTGPFRRLFRWWSSGYNPDHVTFPGKGELEDQAEKHPQERVKDEQAMADTYKDSTKAAMSVVLGLKEICAKYIATTENEGADQTEEVALDIENMEQNIAVISQKITDLTEFVTKMQVVTQYEITHKDKEDTKLKDAEQVENEDRETDEESQDFIVAFGKLLVQIQELKSCEVELKTLTSTEKSDREEDHDLTSRIIQVMKELNTKTSNVGDSLTDIEPKALAHCETIKTAAKKRKVDETVVLTAPQEESRGILRRLYRWIPENVFWRRQHDGEGDAPGVPEETMILIANMQSLWVHITEMKETQTSLCDAYSDRFGDGITDEKCQEVDKAIQVHKESMDTKVESVLSVVQEIQESLNVEQDGCTNTTQQVRKNSTLQKVVCLIQEAKDTNIQISDMYQKQVGGEEEDGTEGSTTAFTDARMQQELQNVSIKLNQAGRLVTVFEGLVLGHNLHDQTDDETLGITTLEVDKKAEDQSKSWFRGWWSSQVTTEPISLTSVEPLSKDKDDTDIDKKVDDEDKAAEKSTQSTGAFRRLFRWYSSGYSPDHVTFPEKDELVNLAPYSPEVDTEDMQTTAEAVRASAKAAASVVIDLKNICAGFQGQAVADAEDEDSASTKDVAMDAESTQQNIAMIGQKITDLTEHVNEMKMRVVMLNDIMAKLGKNGQARDGEHVDNNGTEFVDEEETQDIVVGFDKLLVHIQDLKSYETKLLTLTSAETSTTEEHREQASRIFEEVKELDIALSTVGTMLSDIEPRALKPCESAKTTKPGVVDDIDALAPQQEGRGYLSRLFGWMRRNTEDPPEQLDSVSDDTSEEVGNIDDKKTDPVTDVQRALVCCEEIEEARDKVVDSYQERFREGTSEVRTQETGQVICRELRTIESKSTEMAELLYKKTTVATGTGTEQDYHMAVLTPQQDKLLLEALTCCEDIKEIQTKITELYDRRLRENTEGDDGAEACFYLDTKIVWELESIESNTTEITEKLTMLLQELTGKKDDKTKTETEKTQEKEETSGIFGRLLWWRKTVEPADTCIPQETETLIANMQMIWAYVEEMKQTQTRFEDAYSDRLGDGITEEQIEEVEKAIRMQKEHMEEMNEKVLVLLEEVQQSTEDGNIADAGKEQQGDVNLCLQDFKQIMTESKAGRSHLDEIYHLRLSSDGGSDQEAATDTTAISADVQMRQEMNNMTKNLHKAGQLLLMAEALTQGCMVQEPKDIKIEDSEKTVEDAPTPKLFSWWWTSDTTDAKATVTQSTESPHLPEKQDEMQDAEMPKGGNRTGVLRRLFRWWSTGYDPDHVTFPNKEELTDFESNFSGKEDSREMVQEVMDAPNTQSSAPSRSDDAIADMKANSDLQEVAEPETSDQRGFLGRLFQWWRAEQNPVTPNEARGADISLTQEVKSNIEVTKIYLSELKNICGCLQERFTMESPSVDGGTGVDAEDKEKIDEATQQLIANRLEEIAMLVNDIGTVIPSDEKLSPALDQEDSESIRLQKNLETIRINLEDTNAIFTEIQRMQEQSDSPRSGHVAKELQNMEAKLAKVADIVINIEPEVMKCCEEPSTDFQQKESEPPESKHEVAQSAGVLTRMFKHWWETSHQEQTIKDETDEEETDEDEEDTRERIKAASSDQMRAFLTNLEITWVHILELKRIQIDMEDSHKLRGQGTESISQTCSNVQDELVKMGEKLETVQQLITDLQNSIPEEMKAIEVKEGAVEESQNLHAKVSEQLTRISSIVVALKIDQFNVFNKYSVSSFMEDDSSVKQFDTMFNEEMEGIRMKLEEVTELFTDVEDIVMKEMKRKHEKKEARGKKSKMVTLSQQKESMQVQRESFFRRLFHWLTDSGIEETKPKSIKQFSTDSTDVEKTTTETDSEVTPKKYGLVQRFSAWFTGRSMSDENDATQETTAEKPTTETSSTAPQSDQGSGTQAGVFGTMVQWWSSRRKTNIVKEEETEVPTMPPGLQAFIANVQLVDAYCNQAQSSLSEMVDIYHQGPTELSELGDEEKKEDVKNRLCAIENTWKMLLSTTANLESALTKDEEEQEEDSNITEEWEMDDVTRKQTLTLSRDLKEMIQATLQTLPQIKAVSAGEELEDHKQGETTNITVQTMQEMHSTLNNMRIKLHELEQYALFGSALHEEQPQESEVKTKYGKEVQEDGGWFVFRWWGVTRQETTSSTTHPAEVETRSGPENLETQQAIAAEETDGQIQDAKISVFGRVQQWWRGVYQPNYDQYRDNTDQPGSDSQPAQPHMRREDLNAEMTVEDLDSTDDSCVLPHDAEDESIMTRGLRLELDKQLDKLNERSEEQGIREGILGLLVVASVWFLGGLIYVNTNHGF
ncbi:extracellular matrix-binding protein ebh-like [Branchiostoma floridae]|uniref:Extracellular matrix-binding protein ebh-like n=1 Tax=Branchiostoma floridae TaxID=7739 RepID=A0A9J7MZB5_BRAFL|nr:extracellular matrix-binding protein ebh-like [Branchiostoma floridae]